LKRRLRAIDETVTLDLGRDTRPGDNRMLATLSLAAQAQQRVHLHYRAPRGDASERDFDPYGLAYREGRWYVVGHCHLRRALRSFRLDRVSDAIALPASFLRPAGFDAAAHLAASVATLPRTTTCEVCLSCTLEEAKRDVPPGIGVFELHSQGVLMRSQVDDIDWFARVLARLPFDFRVLAPPELRTALQAQSERLQRLASA